MTIDPRVQRRALELFEALGFDAEARRRIGETEPPEVLAALAALEAAAPRARSRFPTEEDPAERSRPRLLPQRIGAYRLTEPLGEGGMGIVFAAERDDGLFEHRVAIKLVRPDRFHAFGLARFGAERRLLARLDHPGIARLLDGGVTEDGWPYIVMERVDGSPIDVHLDREGAGIRRRVALLRAVCEATHAAHGALVLHGDIKPDNILVGADGRPRLLDFGVARLADAEGPPALSPRTRAYAAPERQGGGPPTLAADIYALGMLLRRLAGRGSGDDPSAWRLDDPDLAAIAAKATAAEPADRYGSVEALAADLQRWAGRRPVLARPRTLGYVTGRFVARHPRATAAAAGALACLLAAALVAAAGWREARLRLGDVRQLAHYQLVVLDHRLERQPRTVALRAELAAEAQSYLDRLAGNPGAGRGLRRDAADGFRRLALVQGAMDRPSLGDAAAARESLRKAERLVAGDRSPQGLSLRAEILVTHARIAAWSGDADAARRLVEAARAPLAQTPPLARAGRLLVESEVAQWDGDFARAAALARQAQSTLAALPPGVEPALALTSALDLEAEAVWYAGAPGRALGLYREAMAAAEQAARRWPDEPAVRWKLYHQGWALGSTLAGLGRADEAVAVLRRAHAIAEAEAARDPTDQVAARNSGVVRLALGQALAGAGRTREGLRLLRESLAERHAAWARDRRDARRGRDVVVAASALGEVLEQAGRRSQACAAYGEAAQAVARLAGLGAITGLDKAHMLKRLEEGRDRACP